MFEIFLAVFSAECTIGMVRGLTPLKHYGTMALWHYGNKAIRHKAIRHKAIRHKAIRCKL